MCEKAKTYCTRVGFARSEHDRVSFRKNKNICSLQAKRAMGHLKQLFNTDYYIELSDCQNHLEDSYINMRNI